MWAGQSFSVKQQFPSQSRNSPHFIAYNGSLPCSQEPTNESSPGLPNLFLKDILILSSHLRLGHTSGSFPQASHLNPCLHLSSVPYVPHAPPISFFSFDYPNNMLLGTDNEDAHDRIMNNNIKSLVTEVFWEPRCLVDRWTTDN